MSETFGPPREIITSVYQMSPDAIEQLALLLEQRGIRAPASTIIGLKSAVGVLSGNGSPETVITANVGTLYRRLDGGAGTSLYVKESGTGNTGWVGK